MSAEHFHHHRDEDPTKEEKPKTTWEKMQDWSKKNWYILLVIVLILIAVGWKLYQKYKNKSDSSSGSVSDPIESNDHVQADSSDLYD